MLVKVMPFAPTVIGAVLSTAVVFVVARVLRRIAIKWALKTAYKGTDKTALMVLKLLGGKKPPLWEFQDSLPQLPLPTIKKSLEKWLASVEPLVDKDEFEKAKAAAKELEDSEDGKKLQNVLAARQREKGNWLTDWWVEFAYLRGRVPLPCNVSFFCTDTYDNMYKGAWQPDQVKRAVSLIDGLLHFKYLLDTQTLKPLRIGGVVPVCMEGYEMVFGTTRIPGETCDTIKTHKVGKDGNAHAMLMIGSSIFKLPLQIKGKRVSMDSLEKAIKKAVQEANSAPKTKWGSGVNAQPNISFLTSRNRTDWAKNRQALLDASGQNQYCMEVIEQALFGVVLLDKPSGCPKSNQTLVEESFVGDGTKIWFDKCYSAIVFSDGVAGSHFEHTFADAPVPGLMVEHMHVASSSRTKGMGYPKTAVPMFAGDIGAELLKWDVDGVPVDQWFSESKVEFQALTSGFHLEPMYWTEFGTSQIKKCKISPDAFCQAALQVASLQYHGRHVLTYESASLRSFKRGRTETIRSASTPMTAFAKAFMEKEHMKPDGKAKVLKMMRDAGNYHSNLSKEAARGEGCDRHLLGLKLAAVTTGQPVPSLFATKAWGMEFELSTSQSPILQEVTECPVDNATQGGGFGPVSNPGVGCSYHPQPDRIYFNVSIRSPDAKKDHAKFVGLLSNALRDMYSLAKP